MKPTVFSLKHLALLAMVGTTLPAAADDMAGASVTPATAIASSATAPRSTPIPAAAPLSLAIGGTIRPASCTMQFDNGGKIDYGIMELGKLKVVDEKYIELEERPVALTVTCPHMATVGVKVMDQRTDSTMLQLHPEKEQSMHFGFGKHNDKPIGTYHLKLDHANSRGDGQPVDILASDGSHAFWHKPGEAYAAHERSLTWAATTDSKANAYREFKLALVVEARLAPPSELKPGEEIRLDGLSSFELTYI